MQQRTITAYDCAGDELWTVTRSFGSVEELKGYLDECEVERAVARIQLVSPSGSIVGYRVERRASGNLRDA